MAINSSEALVTVAIPAYNHENYIIETIESIINQTYQNIELIVVDDGSTDSTWQKLQEIKTKCEHRFTNIHFERQENIGCTRTNHKLTTLARGEYYMVIASDDLAKPNAIELEYKYLKQHPDYVHCTGDNDLIDSNSDFVVMDKDRNITTITNNVYFSTVLAHSKYDLYKNFGKKYENRTSWGYLDEVTYADLWHGNKIPNVGLYRTDALKKVDRKNVNWACDDWALHLQLLKIGKYKVLPDVVGSYRLHNLQQIRNDKKLISDIRTTQFYEIYLLENVYPNYITSELLDNWWFVTLKKEFDLTNNSPDWNEEFYTKKYKEVLEYGYIPLVHYLGIGKYNNYFPSKKFAKMHAKIIDKNLAIYGKNYLGLEYKKNKIYYKLCRHFAKKLIKTNILKPNDTISDIIKNKNII